MEVPNLDQLRDFKSGKIIVNEAFEKRKCPVCKKTVTKEIGRVDVFPILECQTCDLNFCGLVSKNNLGFNTNDDAAVVRLDGENLLVQTVDFFTPIVDDPYQFGQIAAANSLSDIYAMGATPTFALNIFAFPVKQLPLKMANLILEGGADKAAEAGIPF